MLSLMLLLLFTFMAVQLNLNLGGKKAALGKGSKGKKAPSTWLGRLTEALNPATWLAPKTAIDTGVALNCRSTAFMQGAPLPKVLAASRSA
jgi:type IV secretory pathway TrbL component